MDIKSKSIKYAFATKFIAAMVAWITVLIMAGCSIYFLYYYDDIKVNNYYETTDYQYRFTDLVHNVVELNTVLLNEKHIMNMPVDDYTRKEELARYKRIQNNLAKTVNFVYVVKNVKTQDLVTNIKSPDPLNVIKAQKHTVFLSENTVDFGKDFILYDDFAEMLSRSNVEVYAGILDPLVPGDWFYDDFVNYSQIKASQQNMSVLLAVSFLLFLITAIYLLSVAGRREKGGKIVLISIDRIFNDLHALVVLIVAVISLFFLRDISTYNLYATYIFLGILLSFDFWIGFNFVMSVARQFKANCLFTNTLIYVILKGIVTFVKLCFEGKVFKVWIMLLLLCYAAFNGIVFALSLFGGFGTFLIGILILMVFNTLVLIFLGKSLVSLSKIMEMAKSMCSGHLDNSIDTSKFSLAFVGFAEDMKCIEFGLKKAVEEAVKGERMKTDLITNVSHDLKTPLTSIVTYVDLLKKETLNNETADGYVEILEEKAGRLKHLIEDLVEASKASSGNLTVETERVDLYELMQQACGEYEEKLSTAELEIRYNVEPQAIVAADGKYMWRIVENLISNVIKYSQKHSRVYIDIYKSENMGLITIKNISATALDITPEQLTERFVRGDASRTTEGSGLGLSIAQSLTNLQHGSFKIEIDGDLYKVTVALPLWVETQIESEHVISESELPSPQ